MGGELSGSSLGALRPLQRRYKAMRLSIFRAWPVLLALGSAAVVTPAQQDPSQQPSGDAVADAARKARAEQKTEPKAKKVFTNDDIPSAPPPSAPTDATGKPAEAQGSDASAGGKEADNDPKSEGYWRKRFKAQRDKIDKAEKELDILQREGSKEQVQYYPDPQKALMQQYSRSDINDTNAKIDAKKKEIDGLKQGLSDMEDELRKAGGDPGWAR
jgi:hypothetical protein